MNAQNLIDSFENEYLGNKTDIFNPGVSFGLKIGVKCLPDQPLDKLIVFKIKEDLK